MRPEHVKEAPSAWHLSMGQVDNQQAIADRMEALAIKLRTLAHDQIQSVPSVESFMHLAARIYQARRKVDKIFGMVGFAVSPGWDMMLDLYQAKFKGRPVSVTSACIGGACPATTGLRWLQFLESRDLVVKKPDADDKRRFVVELTEDGRTLVEEALSEHLCCGRG